MGKSIKAQLAARPDVRQREVTLTSLGGEALTVVVRRLTVAERDRLLAEHNLGAESTPARGAELSMALVLIGTVPEEGETLTAEEVRAMPAALVDEIASKVMDFNGWTKASKAALDDQFRPTA